MKIEKGKLYYDTESDTLFKADMTTYNYNNFASDKIAVHCWTEEDVKYLKSKYTNIYCIPHKSYYPYVYIRIDRDSSFDGLSCIKRDGYHIITIDKFKEFYPPIIEEEQDPYVWGSIDISKKTDDNNPINPTHYNQYAIQPLDYIEANGFDFCEGNVIKYVSRYKQKNGLEDLKKARVYLDKLIKRYEK